jgi:hypothetical protein
MATPNEAPSAHEDEDVRKIREALRGLRFGAVTVTVQDGVVVQVERTERLRFNDPRSKR